MVIKVGINGFGRIGRIIFRTCYQNDNIQLSAINDPAIDAEYICYLIKFDSTHGKFSGVVTHRGDEIKVNDHNIKIFHERIPSDIPWHEAGVQYVIEASGMFTTLEKASGHLQSIGVRRVIVTAPSVDVSMIVLGVNEGTLSLDHKIISCASSTLYCLAPIIKVLHDNFGVSEGFLTSIHAMTPSLKPLDSLCLRGKHWRDHRSIHQNIIPAATGACKALAKIIPEVKDKISGLAFRVPIVNVSVLDLSIRLKTNTTLQDIMKCIMTASNANMKNIIKITKEENVSSDFVGDQHSCIVDLDSSLQLNPNFFKLICWYENEYSYACRVVDSIMFSERQLGQIPLPYKINHVNLERIKKTNKGKCVDLQDKKLMMSSNCNADKDPESICKTCRSTNMIKETKSRHALLKKPLSSHNSDTMPESSREPKKRFEIFKIWNNTNEASKTNVKQNKASFFHDCVSFLQQKGESTGCVKAQERLENVKREFSKMLNITEDLLKKSCNDKVQSNAIVKGSERKSGELTDNNMNGKNTENNYERTNNPILDTCGDYENKIEESTDKLILVRKKEEIIATNELGQIDVNRSNSKIISLDINENLQLESGNKSQTENSEGNVCVINSSVHGNSLEIAPESYDHNKYYKGAVAEAVNIIIDGLTQKLQIHTKINEQDDTLNNMDELECDSEICNEVFEKYENDINITITDSKTNYSDDYLNKNKPKNFANRDTSIAEITKNCSNDVKDSCGSKNIEINEELMRTTLVYNMNNKTNEINFNKSYSASNEHFSLKIDDRGKDLVLSEQIIQDLKRFVPDNVLIVTDDTQLNTTINNNVNKINLKRNKYDIYDKLDSASASGSENSFEMQGRKSQIIDISDLTNSLEDLGRLEKICKIMEISDELSDKLFSKLDSKDRNEIRNKNWSFRDLCERIKLDEFCNKVFGKI